MFEIYFCNLTITFPSVFSVSCSQVYYWPFYLDQARSLYNSFNRYLMTLKAYITAGNIRQKETSILNTYGRYQSGVNMICYEEISMGVSALHALFIDMIIHLALQQGSTAASFSANLFKRVTNVPCPISLNALQSHPIQDFGELICA